jgi:hypothetical protein
MSGIGAGCPAAASSSSVATAESSAIDQESGSN